MEAAERYCEARVCSLKNVITIIRLYI